MSRRNRLVIATLLAWAVSAQGQAPQGDEGLSGEIAFGYLSTTGNTENENMSLSFAGDYIAEVWEHRMTGLAVRASESKVTTAEAYSLSWQSRRNLADEHNYLFGLAAWNKDKFSGYDQQLREVVGYGRRFLEMDRHSFDAEAGVGFRQSDLRDGTSEDKSILRLSGDYEWTISETATFSQLLAIENGSDNTYTEWVSKLTADVWGNLAIALSYTIRRNSDVPVGNEKRDTFTAVSLEYSF